MDILCCLLIVLGLVCLIINVAISENKYGFPLIISGVILILVSYEITKRMDMGKPAPSLKVLTVGGKYEVVTIYDEKYIIVKSAADNEKLKFIGPLTLNSGSITTGRYVKTVEGLEKIE